VEQYPGVTAGHSALLTRTCLHGMIHFLFYSLGVEVDTWHLSSTGEYVIRVPNGLGSENNTGYFCECGRIHRGDKVDSIVVFDMRVLRMAQSHNFARRKGEIREWIDTVQPR
jgi:hypothetical protein